MAESHVVSGLVAKRSELAGLIQHYQAEISRITGDLNHIDAAIKLFAPEFDLRTLRAKEHRERNQYFKSGECPRMTLDILRESAYVLTSRQIAAELLRRKGLEPSVEKIDQLQKSALNVLKRLEDKGLVMQGTQKGISHTWKIV
ncbi:hypothetical protein [Methylobacter sp.]|uniref:hypothetical protein n=1 Tax=Methylobacter sp. TaxID=2051955 RepID=UPI002487F48B|nr:hypothetical protein [Methylobacter sp.]MDI1278889.1 hypothetical protein [Methylobacter sp.]MDI1359687.1 hypothetical protein [Methylobacter sp.]